MPVDIGKYREVLGELGEKVALVAVSKVQPMEAIRELYELGQRDFGENYVQELVDKQGSLPADIRWHFIGHLQSNKVKYLAPFVHLIQGVDSLSLLREIDRQAGRNGRVIQCLLQVHISQEATKFGFDLSELESLVKGGELAGFRHTRIRGLMGMASFTEDQEQVRAEFRHLHGLFAKVGGWLSEGSGLGGAAASGEGPGGTVDLPGAPGPLDAGADRPVGKDSQGGEGAGADQPVAGWRVRMEILSMGMSGDYKTAIEEGSTMVRIGSLIFGARNYPKA